VELATFSHRGFGAGGLKMHVNKVQRVTTIDRVAADLGESVDWLYDVAMEMDAEDGVISVYGPGDHQVMAFTDFGIDAKGFGALPGNITDIGSPRHVRITKFPCLSGWRSSARRSGRPPKLGALAHRLARNPSPLRDYLEPAARSAVVSPPCRR